MHCWGYAGALQRRADAALVGVWDRVSDRAAALSARFAAPVAGSAEQLVAQSDALVITCENKLHAEYVKLAASAGKPVLCEKPLATTEEEAARIAEALASSGVDLMVAFPCRYAPAFKRLAEDLRGGKLGQVVGACCTNRGRCPFDWFVDPALSGGGAIIDHVVHVADLLWLLFGEPEMVHAQAGSNMYGQTWEDTAMLTIDYENGLFATLDSSWSRPQSFKTWGDVTMTITGEKGTAEIDLFAQCIDHYADGKGHGQAFYGSDLDDALLEDFIRRTLAVQRYEIDFEAGLRASRVAFAAMQSAASGSPQAVKRGAA